MLQLRIVGSHEQVGCEKPSTLSRRQRTVLRVAVKSFSVCVCVSVCSHCIYCVGVFAWLFGGEIQRSNTDPTQRNQRCQLNFVC